MDPNPIQPDTTSVIAIPPSGGSGNLTPPDPKPDKDIPIYILVILFVMVIGSLFLFRYVLQKSTNRPVNTTNINQEPTTLPSLTPTPTPLQGPGPYACSVLGSCKIWDLQIQKENCTTTYADKNCLNQCDDITKRCTI